jgi:competence protein ComEA
MGRLRGRVTGVGDSKAGKFSASGLTVNGTSYRSTAAGPAPAAFITPKAKNSDKSEKKAEKAKSPRDRASCACAAPLHCQSKKARTSSRRASVSATPSEISSRV